MTTISAPTCSALSALDEPLPGTAATAPGYVCLEVPTGWGRDVLDGTALGAELSDELSVRAKAADVRILFIRRPGRDVVRETRERATALVAEAVDVLAPLPDGPVKDSFVSFADALVDRAS